MGLDNLSPFQRPLDAQGILPEVKGVFSSDLLIRFALIKGFEDLRQNPWQLSLIFNGLLDDPYTSEQYGQKEVTKAVNWFLKTEVPIVMDYTLTSSPAMPIVVISLESSQEAEATLGDVHYVPSESTEAEFEPLGQRFSGSYNPATGVLMPSVPAVINTQMILVTTAGNRYPVLGVQVDVNDNENLLIQKGLVEDFSKCVLEWSSKKLSVNLESCNFKESLNITCNVKGETSYLLYLHAIVVYCLMRYKKTLLEFRGYERTTISSTKVMTNNSLGAVGAENVWCRVVTITGYNKMYWATQVSEKVTQAAYGAAGPDGLKVSQVNFLPNSFKSDPSQEDPSYLTGDGIGVST
jgi:hypothetical protein